MRVDREDDEVGILFVVRRGANELEEGCRVGGGAGAGREGVRDAGLLYAMMDGFRERRSGKM